MEIISEWWGIEHWLPDKEIWWSSGTRFSSQPEAEGRASEVQEHKTRVAKYTLTRQLAA